MIDVVCGVIADQGGRLLTCRRGLGRHLGGLWEFPGGKVNEGEKAQDALKRELEEELGIVVEVGEQVGSAVDWTDGVVSIRLVGFRCLVISGEPVALEHEEIRWCELRELAELDWAEADVPLVEVLVS